MKKTLVRIILFSINIILLLSLMAIMITISSCNTVAPVQDVEVETQEEEPPYVTERMKQYDSLEAAVMAAKEDILLRTDIMSWCYYNQECALLYYLIGAITEEQYVSYYSYYQSIINYLSEYSNI